MVSQNAQFPGRYLSLEEFCTCTQTYQKHASRIDPYPQNVDGTVPALKDLCQHILDPIIDHFGREQLQLTYRFCSKDLKRLLAQKDPETGIKSRQVDPSLDQHMAHEKNRNGKYYCDPSRATRSARLGAACDLRICGIGERSPLGVDSGTAVAL